MKALEYLKSLALGHEVSSIPVQLSELRMLVALMEQEQDTNPWSAFLTARCNAIHAFHAQGKTVGEITSLLNLSNGEHVNRILLATKPS